MAKRRELTRVVAPERIEEAGHVSFFMPQTGEKRLWVDLTQVKWISPIGVVGMLALARKAEQRGLDEVQLSLPAEDRVRGYLGKVGFFAALETAGARFEAGTREELDSEPIRPFLPATLVTRESEMEQAANRLNEILSDMNAPNHALEAAWLVMTELTNNAWQHGSDCYVMAQTHTGDESQTPGLQLAIADFGRGFQQSLESRFNPPNEVEAIVMACNEGISSTGDPRRGFGLWYVIEAVDNYPEASLSVVSQDAWVERHGGHFKLRTGPQCGGVFVTAYFPF